MPPWTKLTRNFAPGTGKRDGFVAWKTKKSTVNKNKTKIQSRKRQDLIYEDRSNERYERLTLEDPKT
jgi:hypothetical protein